MKNETSDVLHVARDDDVIKANTRAHPATMYGGIFSSFCNSCSGSPGQHARTHVYDNDWPLVQADTRTRTHAGAFIGGLGGAQMVARQ